MKIVDRATKTIEVLTPQEIEERRRKNKINKIFLGIFLGITILTLFVRIIQGVILDLGFGFNGSSELHLSFWTNKDAYLNTKDATGEFGNAPLYPGNKYYLMNYSMVMSHPNTFWILTQFTWITTILIIMFIVFRFFKFDETVPRWLKWIMTQRTLSLMAMYDTIVSIVFWTAMYSDFNATFVGPLAPLELTTTFLVHLFIPLLIVTYSFIYLVKDKRASILTEQFLYKGMIYPTIYIGYYMLITIVWTDPYEITDVHLNIFNGETGWANEFWVAVLSLFGIWIGLGILFLIHNGVLLKFNKFYDSKNDYEAIQRKKRKAEKLKRREIRKQSIKLDNFEDIK